MSDAHTIEIEFEAKGETLILRDPNLNPQKAAISDMDTTFIASGTRTVLHPDAPNRAQTTGALSVYVGSEKIGMMSWDYTAPTPNCPVKWTPMSQSYRAKLSQNRKSEPGQVRLCVTRKQTIARLTGRLSASVGHLGFAGL